MKTYPQFTLTEMGKSGRSVQKQNVRIYQRKNFNQYVLGVLDEKNNRIALVNKDFQTENVVVAPRAEVEDCATWPIEQGNPDWARPLGIEFEQNTVTFFSPLAFAPHTVKEIISGKLAKDQKFLSDPQTKKTIESETPFIYATCNKIFETLTALANESDETELHAGQLGLISLFLNTYNRFKVVELYNSKAPEAYSSKLSRLGHLHKWANELNAQYDAEHTEETANLNKFFALASAKPKDDISNA